MAKRPNSSAQEPDLPAKLSRLDIGLKIGIIPDDLLYNILHFLDRKNIEHNRLVSKRWNQIIMGHYAIFPLKVYESLIWSEVYGKMRWNLEFKDQPPKWLEAMPSHFLKGAIFRQVDIKFPDDGSIEELHEIVLNYGKKLDIVQVNFHLCGMNNELKYYQANKLINFVLDRIVDAEKLHITFYESALNCFAWKHFNFVRIYESITIDVDFVVSNIKLLDFFENCGDGGQNFHIIDDATGNTSTIQDFEPDAIIEMVKNFKAIAKPEDMYRTMTFNGVDLEKMDLFEDMMEEIIPDFGYEPEGDRYYFAVKRRDEWCLNIEAETEARKVKFSIEKAAVAKK